VAVKLRLVRMGKKKQPTYRVVAADSRSPRDGRFLEVVGTYAPRGRSAQDPEAVVAIDHDKALRWLRHGAQPTERVAKLLRNAGTLDRLDEPPGDASLAVDAVQPESGDGTGAGELPIGAGGEVSEEQA
jgi:small subunit ribosomal protein S16